MKETVPMDLLAGMAIFARVVDSGGISAAARDLRLSKSAVSKQLAALEDRLGARLLQRTTRRMSLTEAGAGFLEHCRRVVAEAEAAESAVGALQAEPRGMLRVNAPMTFGTMHLASAIPDFLARYPQVSVDLALNDRLVDLLDEGFDVAVRIARLADSSLVARRLAPARRVIVAAPSYLDRRGRPGTLAELVGHDILSYTYVPTSDEWSFVGPGGEERVRVEGRLKANNGEVLLAACLAGAGIAALPTFISGPSLRAGTLVRVLPHLESSEIGIHAVWPTARHLSAKVRAFVDFLAERFGPVPYWDA
ncbi:MAG TPA: LysR family transcriptional regulator [Magnetospirillum sp.]|jgi:DNA-binding transcriptional LysR family regulator|nr:LysR family transcriptional regulator [Magnetospirillum sp.]